MEPVESARMFDTTDAAYDSFMGRYSSALAPVFVAHLRARAGEKALDVGCGPGALTSTLVGLLGADAVAACDPSEAFVTSCAARNPGVLVRQGRAEAIPFPDDHFDLTASQLVLHFVADPDLAAGELCRVTRPGGTVGACVWDFDDGMEMLRAFWDSALELDPAAPDEARVLRFGGRGEIAQLFADAGLVDVAETTLKVRSTYSGFDELWDGFRAGIGPAGAYCNSLNLDQQAKLRENLRSRLGDPAGSFTLAAVARTAIGKHPTS